MMRLDESSFGLYSFKTVILLKDGGNNSNMICWPARLI